jgi:hypothetical protein
MSTTNITPRLGQIVRYTLSESDAREITQKRIAKGTAAAAGNAAEEGATYPAMIVRDWCYEPGTARAVAERNLTGSWNAPGGEPNQDALEALTEEEITEEASRLRAASANTASVNLQVFLDGNDTHWVTSRSEYDPSTHGTWAKDAPEFVAAKPNDIEEFFGHPKNHPDHAGWKPDSHHERQYAEAMADLEARTERERQAHRAKWWRPDPRGHWTAEPVAW